MKQKSQQYRKKDTRAVSQEAGFSEAIGLAPVSAALASPTSHRA